MPPEFFFIHLKGKFIRIDIKDVNYIRSVVHHVDIITERGTYTPHLSLKQLETILPVDQFTRVNRGVLINLQKVVSFDKETVYLKDTAFSFGDRYKEAFEAKVMVVIHRENKT